MQQNETNPPSRSTLLYYLSATLEAEQEFQSIAYAASGMFNLSHPDTVQQLELEHALKTIQTKAEIARCMIQWIADHPDSL